MRRQFIAARYGLVLGAGVSNALAFPQWGKLVQRVASHPKVQGEAIYASASKDGHTSLTQVLFHHFAAKRLAAEKDLKRRRSEEFDRETRIEWVKIIHECLYQTAKPELLEAHPYLKQLLPLIRQTPLTVNYNFDNAIEDLLERTRDPERIDGALGYETVWQPSAQFRLSRAVIYHPNGFLPRNLIDGPSEELVFSEETFADQLISSLSGHLAMLANHFASNTCLFIGLSLDDGTLKHLLRQSARLNPGHYHYYVAYTADVHALDVEQRTAMRAANFDVYNLITLFVNDDEILALAELISMDHGDFVRLAKECGVKLNHRYYVTGSVGAGKTTAIGHFRSLATYDEWHDPRLPLLAKSVSDLKPQQQKEVDDWIVKQFAKKNLRLREQDLGIHLVDRCPLDPIAFTPADKWPEKAAALRKEIAMREAGYEIVDGHVIVLSGDPHQMWIRSRRRYREQKLQDLKWQEKVLQHVYDIEGHTVLDTRDLSALEVAKKIARLIHLEDSEPAFVRKQLLKIEAGSVKCPDREEHVAKA